MKITEVFFSLLDFELTGKEPKEEIIKSLNSAVIGELIKIAKAHDLTHLLADALEKAGKLPDDDAGKILKKARKVAIFRNECIKKDIYNVCNILNGAKVHFIRLKGARIRSYYPGDWMRTSCDIDVLVKEEELEKAMEILQKENWKVKGSKTFHDISLYSENGTHLELHFRIKGSDYLKEDVSDKIWDYSVLKEEGAYEYIQTAEYFMFHLISHIATHFITSGCGIKYFLDIYILKDKLEFDKEKLICLLKESGLEKFYKKILDLADVWFNGREHDELTKNMELFILTGGTYGTESHRMKNSQVKSRGKLRYIKRRIFPPYTSLIKRYPALKGKKYLTPVFQAKRLANMLFSGKTQKSVMELKKVKNTSGEDLSEREKMLKGIGLIK